MLTWFVLYFVVWDKKMVHSQFKWSWHHAPTFAPYKAEGYFFPLILANYGNAQTTKTALVVLQSLTPNAQSVFKILAEHQLANEKEGESNHNTWVVSDSPLFLIVFCFQACQTAPCTPSAASVSWLATK